MSASEEDESLYKKLGDDMRDGLIEAACSNCCFCREKKEGDLFLCGTVEADDQVLVKGFYGSWRQCKRRKGLAQELIAEARSARLAA